MTESEWLVSADPAAMLAWLTSEGVKRVPPQSTRDGRLYTDRKLRLFACAWTRSRPEFAWDNRDKQTALDAAERYADGLASAVELASARQDGPGNLGHVSCWPDTSGIVSYIARYCEHDTVGMASLLRCIFGNPFRPVAIQDGRLYVGRNRDDGTWDVSTAGWLTWQGGIIPQMARTLYDERCFDELPVLADALMEAGCPETGVCPACVGQTGHVLVGGEVGRHEPANAMSHEDYLAGRKESWRKLYPSEWKKCPACGGTGRIPHPLLAHCRSGGPHARGCHVLDLLLGKE